MKSSLPTYSVIRESLMPPPCLGEKPQVSIIIPAHNEEGRIGQTLLDYAETFGSEAEFVVVLNGCTDSTASVVRAIEERDSRFHVIVLKSAVGKGGAIRSGFAVARADVVGYVDADGATSAIEFKRLVHSAEGYDAVIASRWLAGAEIRLKQPFIRQIASRVFNCFVRLFFRLPFADTQCGAKVFRRESLQNIDNMVETADFAFDVDLLFALKRSGAKILEVPTVWTDQSNSKVKIAHTSLRMLISLIRLRLRYSIFRVIIPLFDKFMRTRAMKTNRGLSILIINWRDIKNPRAGGAEAYCHEVAKRFVARGHEVAWLTSGFAGAPKEEMIDGVTIHRTGNRATIYFAAAWRYLRSLRDRFDVVIDSENGIPFFTPLFCLKPKVLLVYHVHRRVFLERMPFPINRFFMWVELGLVPFIYRRVPILTISDDTRADLQKHQKTKLPITIVNPGVDSLCMPGVKHAEPYITYVGRLEPYKRVDLLLKAFSLISPLHVKARLRIVGVGTDLVRLRVLSEELGIAGQTDFLGFVTNEQKIIELQQAWIFVSPSSMEGWGISVIEAHACGTPAIAFDTPGLREAILDGLSGSIVKNETAEALAEEILFYLDNDNVRVERENAALLRSQAFTWDSAADKMYEYLLHEALDQPFHLLQEDQTWHVVGREAKAIKHGVITGTIDTK